MNQADLYNIYLNMEKENIILSFKGDITEDLLSSVYQIVEARMAIDNEEPKRKKKFYHVLVECLQNMYHHMESLRVANNQNQGEHFGSGIFTIGKEEENTYRINTGNFILSENAGALKEKIDKINSLNQQELKAYYLERLGSSELSDKGGAGLGIIDIARKSGNKINYDFKFISESYSFFTLSATIN